MAQQTKKPNNLQAAREESGRSGLLQEVGDATSSIIQKAVSILEEEVASGILAAKTLQQSMKDEGPLNTGELENLLGRLRKDAHDVVNIVGEQLGDVSSTESDDLPERFKKNAHEVVDILLNAVDMAPDLITRLYDSEFFAKAAPARKKAPVKKKVAATKSKQTGKSTTRQV